MEDVALDRDFYSESVSFPYHFVSLILFDIQQNLGPSKPIMKKDEGWVLRYPDLVSA